MPLMEVTLWIGPGSKHLFLALLRYRGKYSKPVFERP